MFRDGLLKGKRILVTGGGTGLGREMAAKYLELGAEVFICGRRKEVLETTAAELRARHGGSVKCHGVDIRDAQGVDAMVQAIWDDGGPLTGHVPGPAAGGRGPGAGGESAVRLAGQTIRGVALGVVVTALAQAVWGGVGLAIAGVPYAPVLTAVMLLLCIAQIGVIPVLGSAVAWLYWTGDSTWGTVLLVWTILAATMDNFLRPILIKKGANLPLLLVFAGVVGGLLAFGLIGIFVGPVILAVADTLLAAWIDGAGADEQATDRPPPAGD